MDCEAVESKFAVNITGDEYIVGNGYDGSNEGYHSTGSSGRPSPHHQFDRSPLPSRFVLFIYLLYFIGFHPSVGSRQF